MPELPEIETIRKIITPKLLGFTIQKIKVYNNKLRWLVDHNISLIKNEKVLSIKRKAKYLLIKLKKGYIIIHLGMSGCLYIINKFQKLEKHDHIEIFINNKYIIRYTDVRKFGYWLWSKNIKNNKFLSKLGLEPLSKKFNFNWFSKILKNKKIIIKSILMNNKYLVGIGNIYANESLFKAKILPYRLAISLNNTEIITLIKSIKSILINSIKYGGTTLNNFYKKEKNLGLFTEKLNVYGRKNKVCKKCNNLIKIIKINQRSTFFCLNCQK